jgi:hypothetical protein
MDQQILDRLERIEKIIYAKIDPLIELLQVIIKNNLNQLNIN